MGVRLSSPPTEFDWIIFWALDLLWEAYPPPKQINEAFVADGRYSMNDILVGYIQPVPVWSLNDVNYFLECGTMQITVY